MSSKDIGSKNCDRDGAAYVVNHAVSPDFATGFFLYSADVSTD